MKNLLSLMAAAGLALSLGTAHAADTPAAAASAPTQQQTKMTTCNAEAKGKKGDERKAFMKECLSADKQEKQQTRMKTCNVEAKDKKGDERKAFMKQCLSNK